MLLSFPAIAVAFAGVYGMSSKVEPIIWFLLFVYYAYVISKQAPGKYFLHGFLVSVLNGVWIGIIHSAMSETYFANNPEMMTDYENMPHFASPAVMMLIMGPIIGAVTGLVAGLFAFLAPRVMRRRAA